MSEAPAQVTSHWELARRILNECSHEEAEKLIADSEARAIQEAATRLQEAFHAPVVAERDRLRAEAERLNRIVSKFIATEDGTDWMARAEKAEAQVKAFGELAVLMTPGEHGDGVESPTTPAHLKSYIEELQSEWDGAEERIMGLNAEVKRLKKQHDLIERQIVLPESVPVSYTELARRAETAEAERDQLCAAAQTWEAAATTHLEACDQLRTEVGRLKEGEKKLCEHHDHHFRRATIAEREALDANARAEKAEAELAKERARLLHLFHYESPMAEPGDTLSEWLAQIDIAMESGSQ